MFKVKILFLVFSTLAVSFSNAQPNYQWAKNIGSSGSDVGNSIALDDSGNVFITGYYQGTADFDPSGNTVNLTPNGGADAFLAKYNAAGEYLWAINIGGVDGDIGYDVATDASGNVCVIGVFGSVVDFDPGTGTANLTTNGSGDIFFAKYDRNGNYLWANNIGSVNWEEGRNIITDSAGNIYITGYFLGTADFDPGLGTANLSTVANADIFFAKYDSNGNYLWAKSIGSNEDEYPSDIKIDVSGNVLITGYFKSTADFDPSLGTANLISVGLSDIFFAKYDANGEYIWAKSVGGIEDDFGRGVALDGNNNLYICGDFGDVVDFNPGSGVANMSSISLLDIFYAKYDSNGNYIWAKTIGSPGWDYAYSISVQPTNNDTYITGSFSSSLDFDPGTGTANISTTSSSIDAYLAKYNSSGNYIWAKKIGSSGQDESQNIAIDGNGNIYIAGFFEQTADFDPGSGVANITPVGSFDVFLAKYNECVLSLSFSTDSVSCKGGNNGSATVTATGGTSSYTYSWNTSPAQTSSKATNLKSGNYTVTVTDTGGCSSTSSVTIGQPSDLVIVLTKTNVSCNGGSNGSVSASVNGGTPGYTFSWNSGSLSSTDTNLSVGTYILTVTDVNTCTKTSSVAITEPPVFKVIIDTTNASCGTCANGTATASLTGGVSPFVYLWSSGSSDSITIGLLPGTYFLTITDKNNCIVSDTFYIDFTSGEYSMIIPKLVECYPNPSKHEIIVDTWGNKVDVKIYDVRGNLITNQHFEERIPNIPFRLDISYLSEGLYFIKIENEGFNVFIYKFIKQ